MNVAKSQQPQSLRVHPSAQMSPHVVKEADTAITGSEQKQSEGSQGALPQKLFSNTASNQAELAKQEQ